MQELNEVLEASKVPSTDVDCEAEVLMDYVSRESVWKQTADSYSVLSFSSLN